MKPGSHVIPPPLPPGARGIRQRADEVEQRAKTQLLPHRSGVLHRRVMRGGEAERHARFGEALREHFARNLQVHAQRFEHLRRAGLAGDRAVAVLGDRNAARPQGARCDQGRCGGNVERPGVIAACAAGVDDRQAIGHVDVDRFASHDPRGAEHLVDGGAAELDHRQQRRGLGLAGLAGHDRFEGERRFVRGERRAGREFLEQFFHVRFPRG